MTNSFQMQRVASKMMFDARSFFAEDFGDDQMHEQEIVSQPLSNDVLLGRGKSNQKHPGNIIFRALINEHRASYFAATNNAQKKEVTERVLGSVSGRFLKKLSGKSGWAVVTGNPRRVKVAQALQYRQRITEECPDPMNANGSSTIPHLMNFRQAQREAMKRSFVMEGLKEIPTSKPEPSVPSGLTIENVRLQHCNQELQKVLDLFEPYTSNEPRVCTTDELLWALGYPVALGDQGAGRREEQAALVSLDSGVAPLSCTNERNASTGLQEPVLCDSGNLGRHEVSYRRTSADSVDIFSTLERSGFLSSAV